MPPDRMVVVRLRPIIRVSPVAGGLATDVAPRATSRTSARNLVNPNNFVHIILIFSVVVEKTKFVLL